MDRFEVMRLFVRIVETGSLSTVAREAGIGQPAVSKQISALEDHLGARLLHRTTRGSSPTEAGASFYEAAVRMLDELEAAESSVGHRQLRPAGLVRVAMSAGFGRLVVVPLLPAFYARHPEIALDISISDRFVDLVEEGIDVAVRLGELVSSPLIARRLGVTPRVTVAARDYLERTGEPATPRDLERHACIAFTSRRRTREWLFETADGPVRHHPRGRLHADDAETIRAALLGSLGVAQVPRWLVAAELATGELREVLGQYPAGRTAIHALLPPGRKPAARTRAFVDFLVERFAADPAFGERPAAPSAPDGHSAPE